MRNLYLISEMMKKRESKVVRGVMERIEFDLTNDIITKDEEGFLRVDFMGRDDQWLSKEAFEYNCIASPSFRKKYILWSEYARYYIFDFRLKCA